MTTSPTTSHVLPEPADASVLSQLRNGSFTALDGQLGEVQARFERGELDERELMAAFQPFEATDAALGEQFSGWMEAVPGSYPAHVALSTWMMARAWSFRGGATYDRVSDRGRRGMAHFLEQAEACARHATTLSANPLAAWCVVAGVARTQGSQLTLEQIERGEWPDWYAQPLETNPGSLTLRRNMLLHLRTEWGGSDAMMLAYLRSQEGQLSNQAKQRLWAQYHSQVSHHALHFAKDNALALERAQMAADLHPSAHAQLLTVLIAARTEGSVTDTKQLLAFENTLSYYETHPETPLHNTSWAIEILLEAGNSVLLPRTISVLGHMVAHGNAEAIQELGRLAVKHKGKRSDLKHVPALLERATEEGDGTAAGLLYSYHCAPVTDQVAADLALVQGAQLGHDMCAWEVYRLWSRIGGQNGLGERDRLRFLLVAADSGENDARTELAAMLRAGKGELGEDGVLRPIAGKPIQESLDYAKHLLERAAHEGHSVAQKMLTKATDRDWQAATAKIQKMRAQPVAGSASVTPGARRFPWRVIWIVASLGILILRACVNSSTPPGFEARPVHALPQIQLPITSGQQTP